MTVYDEIKAERERQDAKWGGPAHDDENSMHDWARFITVRVNRLRTSKWAVRRQALLEIASLAVAALESLDRQVGYRAGQDAS